MKISALVDRVEDFEFHFDGEVLKGQYWKYRTTTHRWAKEVMGSLPEVLTEGTPTEITASEKARNEASEKIAARIVADTIKSWNAEDDEGNPLPPSIEVMEQLPQRFVDLLVDHFKELREPKENPPAPSPSS